MRVEFYPISGTICSKLITQDMMLIGLITQVKNHEDGTMKRQKKSTERQVPVKQG
jgi:hypothetical protein